jgi:tripartite-type tricarboxylate transporter receptor subunit TctC
VIGGQVQLIITSPIAAGAHISNGKVRALATTGAQRNPALPDLPTIAESVKGYEISQAWGITVPNGTPAAIVNRLHAEIIKAISQPDTRDRISKLGAVPFTETPGEFAAAIAADRKRLGDVITKTGIVLAD